MAKHRKFLLLGERSWRGDNSIQMLYTYPSESMLALIHFRKLKQPIGWAQEDKDLLTKASHWMQTNSTQQFVVNRRRLHTEYVLKSVLNYRKCERKNVRNENSGWRICKHVKERVLVKWHQNWAFWCRFKWWAADYTVAILKVSGGRILQVRWANLNFLACMQNIPCLPVHNVIGREHDRSSKRLETFG